MKDPTETMKSSGTTTTLRKSMSLLSVEETLFPWLGEFRSRCKTSVACSARDPSSLLKLMRFFNRWALFLSFLSFNYGLNLINLLAATWLENASELSKRARGGIFLMEKVCVSHFSLWKIQTWFHEEIVISLCLEFN